MTRNIIIAIAFILGACVDKQQTDTAAILYFSNTSIDKFDKSFVEVFVDDKVVFSDSVKNRYLSFYWQDSVIAVPRNDFRLKVKVTSNGYNVERDTLIQSQDSLKVFVKFTFEPFYKRYTHPEIYNHFSGETARFKEIADSLYALNLLSNSKEYLNDTIPTKNSILIHVK